MKYCIETDSVVIFDYFEKYSHLLLGVAIFLTILIVFKNMTRRVFLDLSDKYSYYIYIVHQLFILSPFSLMEATTIMFVNWLIVLITIVISAIILKYISDKVTSFMNKKILKTFT